MRGGGFPGRESDVLVGATFPSKKGQVYFGRFYLGKRRTPAMTALICRMEIGGAFGSKSLALTAHLPQKRPLSLVGSDLRPYE